MFGMSLPEILIIVIIAVLFLGPEKLPETMVSIAKFFKGVKKTVNDVKSNFESEIKIAELKQDAQKYKESLQNATDTVRKKLTFEELDEIKKNLNSATSSINESIQTIKNPTKKAYDEIFDTKKNNENTQTNLSKDENKMFLPKSEQLPNDKNIRQTEID